MPNKETESEKEARQTKEAKAALEFAKTLVANGGAHSITELERKAIISSEEYAESSGVIED